MSVRSVMVLSSIIADTSWDNWQNEPEEIAKGANEHWDICQVLFSKLENVKEQLDPKADEDAEHIDTIEQVQSILELLDEETIRNLKTK